MLPSAVLLSFTPHHLPMMAGIGRKSVVASKRIIVSAAAFSSDIASNNESNNPMMLRDPSLLSDSLHVEGGGRSSLSSSDAASSSSSNDFFDVVDPGSSSGRNVIARVRRMDGSDTKEAITRASSALASWKDGTTASHRSNLLLKWSSLIKENANDIATVMTYESGKPIAESHGEIIYGTSYLDYYAAEALRPTSAGGGSIIPTPFVSATTTAPTSSSLGGGGVPTTTTTTTTTTTVMPRGRIMTVNEAIGVCGLITPWNFPIAMITRKVGPALAAGCTIVLKPSELTPLTAVILSVLADRAGIPPGVFELITTNTPTMVQEVGNEICTNTNIKKISFTGSTAVGKAIMKLSSTTVKRLSLELGGNAPFIVFGDADIDRAVTGAISSKFRNAGQTCVCADRFIIHESIVDEFVTKLTNKVQEQITIGHGMKVGVTMGPVITSNQVQLIKGKINDAIMAGATCIYDGSALDNLGPNYIEPTIITNITPNMALWHTETFGPVISIITFTTEEEALALANDTPTGLASYFYTQDMGRIFRVSAALENGIVGVNEGIISSAYVPFGGVKESGLGREGSVVGMNEYLETKYIFLNV